jgi:predicted RNA-binding Zn-ribbon protein involved in translation (DUF1610 family)
MKRLFLKLIAFIFRYTYQTQKMKQFIADVKRGDLVLYEEEPFSSEVGFPWEDVLCCKSIEPPDEYKTYRCPYCGEKEVIWIYFKSPDYTWREMCGRSGPLSICPKCARQIKFICYVMN